MNVPFKKPFNRKLIYTLIFGIAGVGVFAMIALSINDPREAQRLAAEAKAREALERQKTGEEDAARVQLERELARLQAEIDARNKQDETREFDDFIGQRTPGFDPEMLRLLDEAQKQANRSPEIARTVRPNTGRGNTGGGPTGLVYDNYNRTGNSDSAENEDGDLFADADTRSDPGMYDTLRPQSPPSDRIISQGSSLHAVLMSRIDTRNDGQIIAMVTRTIYDSKTMRMPLVPQGSRLVGQYSTSVTPGADRLEVNFNRLILPDGRAFDLPAFQAAGGDGTVGARGKYKSNLLQAIGPSFVVAMLGQVIDRQVNKEIPNRDRSTSPGFGGTYQSPSILEQTMPEINKQILQRYQGARPYFIINPGQRLRVLLSEDVEVPLPNVSSTTGGVR